MSTQFTSLSGDDWQNWANQLLSRHYGPTEYVKIADNQKGDAGIEGYSRCGHAYQCYGCEEPTTTEARYEGQRDKITKDIKKFIINTDKLVPLFGTVVISRWVLFVPRYDSKELVAHANRKREDVVAAGLPYVTDGFQVHVCDEDHFSAERDFLLNARTDSIRLETTEATEDELKLWSEDHDDLLSRLNSKLLRLNTLGSNDHRQAFREDVLRWYVEGQAMLSNLRNYPQTHEKVLAAKAHREKSLVRSFLTHEGTSAALLNQTLARLFDDYCEAAKELAKPSLELLAQEAVSDWLLRCPLDFPR